MKNAIRYNIFAIYIIGVQKQPKPLRAIRTLEKSIGTYLSPSYMR